MFLVSVPRIFKTAMRVPCAETTSRVACEISALYNFLENSYSSTISMFRKVALLEIFKNSLLTGDASL